MGVIEAIVNRRSIRRFKDEPVDHKKITQILEAGRLAPSGSNSQPWKFLVIQTPEKKAALADACYNQKFISQAPFVVVVLGCQNAYRQRLRRTKELVTTGAVEPTKCPKFAEGYKQHILNDSNAIQSIVSNCVIAGQNMVLAAEELDLGSCWVMLMDYEKMYNVLELTDELIPVAVIPFGYPDQEPKQRPRYELADVAWDETVGNTWSDEN